MFTDSFWLESLGIFILILANGFFASSEIAFISARRSRIKKLAEQGDSRAKTLLRLQGDPDRFITTVQIGVTLVGSLASALGGAGAVRVLEPLITQVPFLQSAAKPIALGLVVVVISYLSLVLGELVPKSLALRRSEAIALGSARAIDFLARLSGVFVRFLRFSSRVVLGVLGIRGGPAPGTVSQEEIKLLMQEGKEQGIFNETELKLIKEVFEFTDIAVKEVMVPRPRIDAIALGMPVADMLAHMLETRYSRYPVYGEDLDDIKGVLYYKDLLAPLKDGKPVVVSELLKPVYYVPETMKVSQLLREMQRRRQHLAIVVGEHGSLEGLVTLEDLLEEIVGEIHDEYDEVERPVEVFPDGSLVAYGALPVRELRENYHVDLPESGEYETLAGFVLTLLQRIPRGGEVVQSGELKFTVVDMDGRRVAKVKIERVAPPVAAT
ncbi:MAG: HlyC/CorC family transporter [Deinococcus sp.]|nr:HlyC/CorC family transporter [Deinococcus sp.]